MRVNSNGLRLHQVIMGRFHHGSEPINRRPGDGIIVGFGEKEESGGGFNRRDDPTRNRVPYEVVCIDCLNESDDHQLLGLQSHYSPGRLVVHAVRLSPAPNFERVSDAERIIFGIGPHLPGRNEPFVEWVERVGRRTSSGAIVLSEDHEFRMCKVK